MQRIQYSIYRRETMDASGKAKSDVSDILSRFGFQEMYHPSNIRMIRILQQYISLYKLRNISKIFCIQYPAIHSKFYDNIKKCIRNGDISIAIVHDLDSLRYAKADICLSDEISFLSEFSYIIVPTHAMAALFPREVCSKIIIMQIYDYLCDEKKKNKSHRSLNETTNSIVFAGNLEKSTFLRELHKIIGWKFLLYGKMPRNIINNYNITYKGSLPAEQLIYEMDGDYGLVWDGNSIQTCCGETGKYLKFNSPHKLSSYIVAGKPVIIWKEAAMAKFVEDNKIGLVIDSLEDLVNIDDTSNYSIFKNNVLILRKKLATGHFLTTALNQILENNT